MATASNNISAEFINEFSIKIYKALSKPKENFFISPYSISTALSMCFIGAKSNTHSQLKSLLCYDKSLNDEDIIKLNEGLLNDLNSFSNSSLSLNVANKLFPKIDYEIRQDYLEKIRKHFKSDVENLDYSNPDKSSKTINKWVSDKTNGMIKDLVPSQVINNLTRLILVNAIYFKGNWSIKFDKENTKKDDFHLEDGSKVKVDMMSLLNKKFKYQSNPTGLEACTCQLPYQGDSISMTIILPNKGVSLSKIEEKLSANTIKSIVQVNVGSSKVSIYLPKFKFEHKIELSEQLSKLGAPDAFSENKADFTGIYDKKNELFISKVIHQAVVDVNEEGTEAAAATAVIMAVKCAAIRPDPIFEFKCDRPFIFIIHDNKNGAILFMGKYVKPL